MSDPKRDELMLEITRLKLRASDLLNQHRIVYEYMIEVLEKFNRLDATETDKPAVAHNSRAAA